METALKNRRTRRSFLDGSLTLKQVSQMLWSAQGVTVDWGGRTTPSAKSTYPLSVYIVANKVDGLDAGEYLYIPGDRTPVHQLKTIKKGEFGEAIFTALNQNSFKDVPAVVVITGNMGKMAQAFGGIAQDKDVYLEVGHAAQNMYLGRVSKDWHGYQLLLQNCDSQYHYHSRRRNLIIGSFGHPKTKFFRHLFL